jgi:catechol 2,3-dioxygenase-like lactoylglutathione lyase family enzyme
MLKTTGLVAGHYECRSLDETLPVFTDLLAMEIVERRPGEATVKHPNTDWRLIIHEGGPGAPEKTFDNHYGFRVASHSEVEAAWQYIEANKEKYRLSKITKPQSAHFAYSIYFREPGGNHLEIEYYNPGGALHGRSHTAGHWEHALNHERFPGRGYVPQAFTHGTLQCDHVEKSRRFYVEVLGLEIAAGFNMAQYIKHPSTPWYIVSLERAPELRVPLTRWQRYTIAVESPAALRDAHRRLKERGEEVGVTELEEIKENGESVSFLLTDPDRNWWEVSSPASVN